MVEILGEFWSYTRYMLSENVRLHGLYSFRLLMLINKHKINKRDRTDQSKNTQLNSE